MELRRLFRTAVVIALLGYQPAQAQIACRQALALGLDISGSVDVGEYRLQSDGLAAALVDPGVIDAFLSLPDAPVRLFVYEWAGLKTQRVLIDWIEITSAEQLEEISLALIDQPRQNRQVATALGVAINYGAEALMTQSDCWKLTLDISGDGPSNIGTLPRDLRTMIADRNITVNGLVVGVDPEVATDSAQQDVAELISYYRAEVMNGADAFVVSALGFADYQRAMTRKLLRELEVLAIGQLDVPGQQMAIK